MTAMKLKDACSLEGRLRQSKTILKKKKNRHHFANKGLGSQSYGFSNSHIWMSELDYKED